MLYKEDKRHLNLIYQRSEKLKVEFKEKLMITLSDSITPLND